MNRDMLEAFRFELDHVQQLAENYLHKPGADVDLALAVLGMNTVLESLVIQLGHEARSDSATG